MYGQTLPNMAKHGRFWGPPETPRTIFDGSNGVELVPPYVRYNIQPPSTGVQPKKVSLAHLWPNIAKYVQKWPFLGASCDPRVALFDTALFKKKSVVGEQMEIYF